MVSLRNEKLLLHIFSMVPHTFQNLKSTNNFKHDNRHALLNNIKSRI